MSHESRINLWTSPLSRSKFYFLSSLQRSHKSGHKAIIWLKEPLKFNLNQVSNIPFYPQRHYIIHIYSLTSILWSCSIKIAWLKATNVKQKLCEKKKKNDFPIDELNVATSTKKKKINFSGALQFSIGKISLHKIVVKSWN